MGFVFFHGKFSCFVFTVHIVACVPRVLIFYFGWRSTPDNKKIIEPFLLYLWSFIVATARCVQC